MGLGSTPRSIPSRADAELLDEADPLAGFRDQFVVPDPGLIYLNGNSLGRLPITTQERLHSVIDHEWADDLVRGWDRWIDWPRRVGDRLGTALLGTQPGEVVVCDSTTVNLYKVAFAALALVPDRPRVVVGSEEFPTDRYVLEGLAASSGREFFAVPAGEALTTHIDDQTALVVASLVDFRTAALADLAGTTKAVHRAGAKIIWDLSHAVGAVEIDLRATGVEFAVGCTYKYLNAGPGSPAFVYVRSDIQQQVRQPIWGWFGQHDQFAMGPRYEPVTGIEQFLTGTPSVLGLVAVDEGVALLAEAGIDRAAAKARALTDLLIALADEWLAPLGFAVVSPRDGSRRGGHVALSHPAASKLGQALIDDAGVVGDCRPPDLLRLCPAPLYTRFVDVWDGMARIRDLNAW